MRDTGAGHSLLRVILGKAMSQENMQVVRRLYSLLANREAWRRREYDHVFLEYCYADYELIPPPTWDFEAEPGLPGRAGHRSRSP